MLQFSSVLSHVQPFATPWTTARQASLSISYSRSLLKLMSIELVMPSNHLILSSPSPPAVNLSQHQDLFQWVSSLHQVAKVLELQLHQSFQWIFRRVEWFQWFQIFNEWFPLGLTVLISLHSKGLSRVSSNTTVQNASQCAILLILYKNTATIPILQLRKPRFRKESDSSTVTQQIITQPCVAGIALVSTWLQSWCSKPPR